MSEDVVCGFISPATSGLNLLPYLSTDQAPFSVSGWAWGGGVRGVGGVLVDVFGAVCVCVCVMNVCVCV